MSTEPRYKVIEGSDSGHCCFAASVEDTELPGVAICECFEVTDAEKICAALNAMEELLKP